MTRTKAVLLEFTIWPLMYVAIWAAIGVPVSFVFWANAYVDPLFLTFLRWMILMGFSYATFTSYSHIKNGKI